MNNLFDSIVDVVFDLGKLGILLSLIVSGLVITYLCFIVATSPSAPWDLRIRMITAFTMCIFAWGLGIMILNDHRKGTNN